MKVSLNWVKQFTDINLGVDELVEKIGAQLGAVEEVIDLGKKYRGVVVAKVVGCEDHPNADRLHVCKIDDGGKTEGVERDENGHVQVVCGAPNVREGLTVAWLPPGSTVPATFDHDPFVLEARELRGVVSNGMLASPKELAIGDGHEGILEIDQDAAPGTSFAEIYGLNDYIIDIENKMFTHRPDCFGQLGVAREIAGISHQKFTSPDWYKNPAPLYEQGSEQLPLEVLNQITDVVPRFMAVVIKDVQVKPSPVWLQTYLTRVGIRPINNVVDTTNYMMMLTGQPLHAYDYDKVRAQDPNSETAVLCVRHPLPSETVELLNGKSIMFAGQEKSNHSPIVIASATKVIGLGGVMGGASTEVDENTKNIILECASFDMYSIRKTSMIYGLFSDAVTRFNKGQSPLQNARVLNKAVEMLGEIAHAAPAGKRTDAGKDLPGPLPVDVSADFINARLGLKLSAEEMAQLLRNVEFDAEAQGEQLTVTAPFWRRDIEIAEDVVEEVGRLYGFDHLPLELPKRTITPGRKDALLATKAKIRQILSAAGANEVLTYSFVHGNLLDKVGQDKSQAFSLSNALSPDLQYYRLSLIPSLLEKVHPNIKAGYDEFALFEMGKVHVKGEPDPMEPQVPDEKDRLAMVLATNDKTADPDSGAAYYKARKYFVELTFALGISPQKLIFKPLHKVQEGYAEAVKAWAAPYEPARSAMVLYNFPNQERENNTLLAVVGELRQSVQKALKLPEHTAAFEADTVLLQLAQQIGQTAKYVALPKYPKVEQDITLRMSSDVMNGDLHNFFLQYVHDLKKQHYFASIQGVDIYQGDDKAHKNVTFRVSIASYEKTMKAEEVNSMLDEVAKKAKEKFGAERL